MTLIHKRAKISQREPATLVVAASDSKNKQSADYICPGTDDLDYITNTVVPQLPANGGKILLLEGTYYCNTSGKPLLISSKTNVTLEGQGYGTKIYFNAGGFTSDAIKFDGCGGNITIRDLFVDSNVSTGWGIYVASSVAGSNVYIENCKSIKADYGFIVYGGSPAVVSIIGCEASTCTTRGIAPLASTSSNLVTGCYATGCATGIFVSGYSHVIGNFLNNNTNGIVSYGDLFGQIIGNSVYGGTNGITIWTSRSGTIADNATYNTAGYGIKFTTAYDYTVIGNRIYECDTGIYVDAGSNKLSIHSNVFEHTVTGSTSKRGIYLETSACSQINIRNNQFDSWTSGCWVAGNYVVEGTNTIGTGTIWYDPNSDSYINIAATNSGAIDTVVLTSGMPVAISLTNQLDVPRNITFNIRDADASISGISISLTGYDAKGQMWTDTYTNTSGVTDRAWSTLVSADVTAVYGESSGDALYVGYGSKLGLAGTISASSDVYRVIRNGSTITSGYTVNASYDTVDISGIVLGTDIEVRYRKNSNILPRV